MEELRPQGRWGLLRVMLSARPPVTQQVQLLLPHRSNPSILQPYPVLPRLS